jgi:hypothetical protein
MYALVCTREARREAGVRIERLSLSGLCFPQGFVLCILCVQPCERPQAGVQSAGGNAIRQKWGAGSANSTAA